MGEYKEIEHGADIGYVVSGDSVEDLFETALLLFTNLSKAIGKPEFYRIISIKDNGYDRLLVTLLNELIYRFEVKGEGFIRYRINAFSDKGISLTAWGKRVKGSLSIKATTFNELQIKKVNEKYITKLVFDV